MIWYLIVNYCFQGIDYLLSYYHKHRSLKTCLSFQEVYPAVDETMAKMGSFIFIIYNIGCYSVQYRILDDKAYNILYIIHYMDVIKQH